MNSVGYQSNGTGMTPSRGGLDHFISRRNGMKIPALAMYVTDAKLARSSAMRSRLDLLVE